MTVLNNNNIKISFGPRKYYRCSQCENMHALVIEIDSSLVCVKCRYDAIGENALKEPLFWDL